MHSVSDTLQHTVSCRAPTFTNTLTSPSPSPHPLPHAPHPLPIHTCITCLTIYLRTSEWLRGEAHNAMQTHTAKVHQIWSKVLAFISYDINIGMHAKWYQIIQILIAAATFWYFRKHFFYHIPFVLVQSYDQQIISCQSNCSMERCCRWDLCRHSPTKVWPGENSYSQTYYQFVW